MLSRELRPKKYVGSFGTVGETQEPYETDEKMEMAKQDTTKTSFLTLSGSKISIVSQASYQKPKEINI